MGPEPMYTVAEIAAAWNVSKNYIYDLIAAGKLAAVNLPSSRAKTRVRKSALDAYVDQLTADMQAIRSKTIRGVFQQAA